ncbi:5'-nucleotidase C-terminal domain-containing protein [Anaerosalibacter sp. Marseille-P3206]|uniref:5'-nucleotidase C-terminal domain-containing protein n=1 Tax=Anaerosalibacter sp. Marseille-P3206 TaxID=1871005 RepID=UPI0009857A54|nr:5'-nucleotidase C-terminal domain-containing protein [Anaerosalibacter sp. Marseille-P3206]
MQKFFKNFNCKCLLSLLLVFMMLFSISTPFTFAEEVKAKEDTVEVKETTDKLPSEKENESNTVDVILFNDFHGNLAEDIKEGGKNIGMAKMVAYVNEAVKNNPNTIVVSGGDNYQGTAMSNLTYGEPVSAMMKSMNVVASAVGNHEFDWGVDLMEKWSKEGGFDFLAANIYDTKTNEPVSWAKPYKIVEKGGIKIAFIGLAHPDTVTLTKAENVTGIEFRDPVKSAEEWVKYLKDGKAEEGVPDVIMALTHIDSKQDRDTKEITGNAIELTKVEGLDAILSAHSHQTVCGKVNDVPVIQAYKYGRAMGIVSIELDKNNKVKDINIKVDDVAKNKNDIIPDEEATKKYEEYNNKLQPILGEVLGEASDVFTHDRSESNVSLLGRWVCEVLRDKTDAQVAIQNGGGLRRTLEKGNITMGDLYEIMPFDNSLVTLDLSGKDLKKAIDHGILNPEVTDGQFAGLIVEYDKDKEFENRITKITLEDGTPLEMDKYYKVVISDFLLTGGDKYDFSNAKNVVETFVPIRDVLVDAIKEAKVITPKAVDYMKEAEKVVEEKPVVVPEKENKVVVKEKSYVVKAGDVLWKIAEKFNTTWEKLAQFNKLNNPHLIFPGQKILIPAN